MSLLTDVDIRQLHESGELKIEPFQEVRLTPADYNLSIGQYYISRKALVRIELEENEGFTVAPGESVAIRTWENIGLPKDRTLSGLVQSKIKMVKAGFGHIATTVDSDHNGHMIVIVQNHSQYDARLTRGQPFCTLVFLKNSSPTKMTSNNTYDEHEIAQDLIEAWSSQRPELGRKSWRILKPLLPIFFVLLGSGAAVATFGGQLAFGGVIAIVGTVAVLLERYMNR